MLSVVALLYENSRRDADIEQTEGSFVANGPSVGFSILETPEEFIQRTIDSGVKRVFGVLAIKVEDVESLGLGTGFLDDDPKHGVITGMLFDQRTDQMNDHDLESFDENKADALQNELSKKAWPLKLSR